MCNKTNKNKIVYNYSLRTIHSLYLFNIIKMCNRLIVIFCSVALPATTTSSFPIRYYPHLFLIITYVG